MGKPASNGEPARNWSANVRGETFTQALIEEGERGQVLVAATFLDNVLTEYLRVKFEQEGTSAKLSENLLPTDPERYSPISAFATKIKVCRAFGLIVDDSFGALEAIRALRNSFAHADFKIRMDAIPPPMPKPIKELQKPAMALDTLRKYLAKQEQVVKCHDREGNPVNMWWWMWESHGIKPDNPPSNHQVFLGASLCLYVMLSVGRFKIAGQQEHFRIQA
jgi:hypothetical protein